MKCFMVFPFVEFTLSSVIFPLWVCIHYSTGFLQVTLQPPFVRKVVGQVRQWGLTFFEGVCYSGHYYVTGNEAVRGSVQTAGKTNLQAHSRRINQETGLNYE